MVGESVWICMGMGMGMGIAAPALCYGSKAPVLE